MIKPDIDIKRETSKELQISIKAFDPFQCDNVRDFIKTHDWNQYYNNGEYII